VLAQSSRSRLSARCLIGAQASIEVTVVPDLDTPTEKDPYPPPPPAHWERKELSGGKVLACTLLKSHVGDASEGRS